MKMLYLLLCGLMLHGCSPTSVGRPIVEATDYLSLACGPFPSFGAGPNQIQNVTVAKGVDIEMVGDAIASSSELRGANVYFHYILGSSDSLPNPTNATRGFTCESMELSVSCQYVHWPNVSCTKA